MIPRNESKFENEYLGSSDIKEQPNNKTVLSPPKAYNEYNMVF